MQKFSGKELRRRREMSGKRLELMAVELGRSRDSIASYEAGRRNPPLRVVAELAANLGCEPGAFFTEEADDVA
jgi:transcriptional regulator with XRE-family HTH domain